MNLLLILVCLCLFIQNSKIVSTGYAKSSVNLHKKDFHYNKGRLERNATQSRLSSMSKTFKPTKFKSAKDKNNYLKKYHRTNNNNG